TPGGLISGIPTSTGSFTTNIDVISNGLTRRVAITIVIDATSDFRRIDFGLGPIITDSAEGRGAVITLTPTGVPSTATGAYTWTLVGGALPPNTKLLTGANLPSGFSAPTAVLAGAPGAPGTYNFRVRVDDSTGNFGIRDATWTVTALR